MQSDIEYQNLIGFIDFIKNITDQTALREISERCKSFKIKTEDFLKRGRIDLKELELIVESKSTYQFAINHQGENFNDLYERLDTDNELVNSTVVE